MIDGAYGRMAEKVNTMIKRTMLLACTSLTVATAFDNEPGWKMDGDKIATDANGDPIYIDASGRESAVKHDAISQRNREAQQHRQRAEEAEAELAKFKVDGKLIDPETAKKAVKTIKDIDAKKLIDAGEVDKVRDEVRNEFTTQLDEAKRDASDWRGKYENKLVDDVFNGEFMQNVAMPKDFFSAAMRNNFKVEEGKIVAYDKAGNRLMSKKSPGDYASPDEALELLVQTHPQKDTILKAPDASGSGNSGGGGNRGGGRTMRRAEFDALQPQQKAESAAKQAKGELTIVD